MSVPTAAGQVVAFVAEGLNTSFWAYRCFFYCTQPDLSLSALVFLVLCISGVVSAVWFLGPGMGSTRRLPEPVPQPPPLLHGGPNQLPSTRSLQNGPSTPSTSRSPPLESRNQRPIPKRGRRPWPKSISGRNCGPRRGMRRLPRHSIPQAKYQCKRCSRMLFPTRPSAEISVNLSSGPQPSFARFLRSSFETTWPQLSALASLICSNITVDYQQPCLLHQCPPCRRSCLQQSQWGGGGGGGGVSKDQSEALWLSAGRKGPSPPNSLGWTTAPSKCMAQPESRTSPRKGAYAWVALWTSPRALNSTNSGSSNWLFFLVLCLLSLFIEVH